MNAPEQKLFLQTFFQNLPKSKKSLLLLDYDGTLAPFHADRHQAYPYPGVCERLQTILEKKTAEIIIISGRNVQELIPLLKLSPLPELWGCHGSEWISTDGQYHSDPLDEKVQRGLDQAYAFSKTTQYLHKVELKPFSIALHWRGEDLKTSHMLEQQFQDEWNKIAIEHALELLPFNGGLELRPIGRNKGAVISHLLSKHPESYPIAYLGDDITDEQAFASLGKSGLKVLVNEQPMVSCADIRLTPPLELLEFLDLWIKIEGPQ